MAPSLLLPPLLTQLFLRLPTLASFELPIATTMGYDDGAGGASLTMNKMPPAALSQAAQLNYESTAFSSPHWPQCCNTRMLEVYPCLFRIPLTISVENIVLAFAEGRPGLAQSSKGRACEDGSGRSIWMRRSVTAGRSWDPQPKAIVSDTDPWHEALDDGVVIGAAVYERKTEAIFLFYTTCYHQCSIPGSSPTTLFVKSSDRGLSWNAKQPTNLTSMMVKEQVFMMQFGEGLGVQFSAKDPHYPNRLLVYGWDANSGGPAP
jgi:hypothetical protein